MLKIAPGDGSRRPDDTAPPTTPARHTLYAFAGRLGDALGDCIATMLEDGCDPPVLLIERPDAADAAAAATWLVTEAESGLLRLEVLVGEIRLDLLAEGPPDRILSRLARLNRRAAIAGLNRRGAIAALTRA